MHSHLTQPDFKVYYKDICGYVSIMQVKDITVTHIHICTNTYMYIYIYILYAQLLHRCTYIMSIIIDEYKIIYVHIYII